MFWAPENPRARKAADPHRRFPRSRQPRRGGAPSGALKARAEQRTTSFFGGNHALKSHARPAGGRLRARSTAGVARGGGRPLWWDRSRSLAPTPTGSPPHAPAVAPRPSPRALATGFAPPRLPRRPPAAASPPPRLGGRPRPRRPLILGSRPQPRRPPPRASAVAVGELVLACCRIATLPPRASAAACDRGPRAVTDSLDLGAPYRSCELRQEPRRRFSARPSPAFGDGLAMECFT